MYLYSFSPLSCSSQVQAWLTQIFNNQQKTQLSSDNLEGDKLVSQDILGGSKTIGLQASAAPTPGSISISTSVPVPAYEINDNTIEIFYQLYQSCTTVENNSQLLLQDLKLKTQEYQAESMS